MQSKTKEGFNPIYKVIDDKKYVDASFFFSSNEIPKDLAENYITIRVARDSMVNGSINDTPIGAYVLGKKVEIQDEFDGLYGYIVLTNKGYTLFGDLTYYKGHLMVRYRNIAFQKQFGVLSLKINEVAGVYEVIRRQF